MHGCPSCGRSPRGYPAILSGSGLAEAVLAYLDGTSRRFGAHTTAIDGPNPTCDLFRLCMTVVLATSLTLYRAVAARGVCRAVGDDVEVTVPCVWGVQWR